MLVIFWIGGGVALALLVLAIVRSQGRTEGLEHAVEAMSQAQLSETFLTSAEQAVCFFFDPAASQNPNAVHRSTELALASLERQGRHLREAGRPGHQETSAGAEFRFQFRPILLAELQKCAAKERSWLRYDQASVRSELQMSPLYHAFFRDFLPPLPPR